MCRTKFMVIAGLLLLLIRGTTCYAQGKPVIYFGINLRYSPIMLYNKYQPLMDYLSSQTPYKFELKVSANYAETLLAFERGETQICSFGDGAYVDAIIRYGAVPVVKPLNSNGVPFYRSALIVLDKSPLKSIKDLKGRNLALGYSHSISGNLIPRFFLHEQGLDPMKAIKITNFKNHEAVAKAILNGAVDAGVVKDVVADRYKVFGIRVMAYSSPIPAVPIVASKDTPVAVIRSVKAAFLNLGSQKDTSKKILEMLDEEYSYGFISATRGDYQEIVDLYRSVPLNCGGSCHQ